MIFLTTFRFKTKIIAHILYIVFITRPHIFLSKIHLKIIMEFLVLVLVISQWSVDQWSVQLVGSRCLVVVWSFGWLVCGQW